MPITVTAGPTWSETVDTFFASTWAYRKEKAVEQQWKKTPFFFWMRERDRIEYISGYKRIEVPVEYGDNNTVRWISKGDTVPMTDAEIITLGYEEWKYVSASIIRWFQDDQQNRGKAALMKLADIKLGAAERTLVQEFERVLFADGTGSKEPNGLQNLVAAAPTTGTVHGLNRATYSWWRNQQVTATGSFGTYGISDMRTCLNNILQYADAEVKDIVILTNQTIFEYYEDECYDMKSLQNTMLADAGFNTLTFKGRPIMWSPFAPSGNMYFLHTGYLKFMCDESYWMDMTDWKQIPDQPNDRVSQIVCVFNMICTRPIVQLVLTGITA
uniref:Putative capsid protein n=1 Tax=viral metagenome TaxID=1070528 RepID=A0A6M3KAJ2_9ZZZZ